MTSGGARARGGRPPDPEAIRRDRKSDQAGWVTLPERRDAPPPAWPLTRCAKRESEMWTRLWATPQAVMWEQQGMADEVAVYVRTFCEASATDGTVAQRTLVLRQMEGLGLSAAGLARNRWRLSTAPTERREATQDHGDRRTSTVKERFKVIQGEAAG